MASGCSLFPLTEKHGRFDFSFNLLFIKHLLYIGPRIWKAGLGLSLMTLDKLLGPCEPFSAFLFVTGLIWETPEENAHINAQRMVVVSKGMFPLPLDRVDTGLGWWTPLTVTGVILSSPGFCPLWAGGAEQICGFLPGERISLSLQLRPAHCSPSACPLKTF